jgi:thymidylate synthase (FAD)
MDILADTTTNERIVLKNGFVKLIDCMPRVIPEQYFTSGSPIRADYRIVDAARVSYSNGADAKKSSTDQGLLRYLMRHQHTTPFEMVKFTFIMKMPIFIARQHFRHRMANINEVSGRYSVLEDEFYVPDKVYMQSSENNQGASSIECDEETQKAFQEYIMRQNETYKQYLDLVSKRGVSKESARIGLPQNLMTTFYWTIDLHNLLHYLHLRMDGHAQYEIREYATAIASLIQPIVPVAYQAFQDYIVNGISITAPELEMMESGVDCKNKREKKEWECKKEKLKWL